MKPGEVLAGRFELSALAGRGGMGTILRAHDRLTGEPVAVKILPSGTRAGVDRFLLEARTLAEFAHPSIVRYVAHGLTPDGDPYLAMEWLEGEDLSQRLARQALGAADAIAVLASAAEGLAVAHAAGVVHRDVKPANIFLVGGDPGRVKLLDFGVARLFEGGAGLTRTGAVVGTAGYMAPEQARGQRTIDARADVFALGCVLFECLTGRAAFAGDHVVAVLAKVLREEVPPIRSLRPEAPPELDDLCSRMLSKDPPSRPADGAAVARELRALPPIDFSPLPSEERRSSITGSEQRLLTVMLLAVDSVTMGLTRAPSAATGDTAVTPATTGDTTVSPATRGDTSAHAVNPDRATVELADSQTSRVMAAEITHRFGSELVSMLDGSMLISSWGGSASDLAIRSAACALAFSARFPEGRIGLTMGRGETSSGLPFGPLIDEAARRLPAEAGIALDPTLAGLLDARFLVEETERGPMLRGYSDDAGMRTLLGKPTPCVGREKELAQLSAVWAECTGEGVARVVLVTGPPGAGKSRLQHELLSRVRRQGDVTVLLSRLSAITASSAFALARQLVQQAAGVREGMPQDEQFVALEHHLRGVAPAADVPRLAELLGELLGAPTPRAPSPPLRAARSDPRILHDAIKRAFEDWLAAEVTSRPLLVVLEDLHFADPASVAFLDEALRRLCERPWMILALARPEVHDAFPRLWTAHAPQEIPLGKLTRRAAERLVRAALGDDIDPAVLHRIVDRADGNAFYLEELIRSVATSRSDELPATVLAMVQSRLERLEPEARRALRAASIFGEVFWSGGVAALLSGRTPIGQAGGHPRSPGDAGDWLRILRDRELLSARPEAKFPGETEYVFRHALLRDGAYAMLTEADRTAGHRGAAAWLEAHGEGDAVVLADHFVRGDEPVRARPWLLRAARAAVRGSLYEHSVSLSQRAIDLGASGEELSDLLVTQGLSLGWRGRWTEVLDVSRRAVPCARQSSASFYLAAAGVFFAEAFTGTGGESVGLAMTVAASSPPPDAASSFAFAVQMVVMGGLLQGQKEVALALLDRLLLRAREADVADDLLVAGWLGLARTYASLWAHADLGRALADAEAASAAFAAAGDVREGGGTARLFAAVAAGEAGLLDEAEEGLRATVDAATAMGARFLLEWGAYYLARVEIQQGRHAGALERLKPLCASSGVVARMAQAYSALALHEMGRLAEAEAEAWSPLLRSNAVALTLRLRAARAEDDTAALRELVPKVDRFLRRDVMSPLDNTRLALEWVLALRAQGDSAGAAAATDLVRRRVARIAASLSAHPEAHAAFRTAIPENARILALGEG